MTRGKPSYHFLHIILNLLFHSYPSVRTKVPSPGRRTDECGHVDVMICYNPLLLLETILDNFDLTPSGTLKSKSLVSVISR